MVTAVSRSYTTLALGILLLGYLSTELLPHRALSLGLALCGGGAFLYGALVSFAEGTPPLPYSSSPAGAPIVLLFGWAIPLPSALTG